MIDTRTRAVFLVSESTGITAQTMAHSLLSQFPQLEFNYHQRSFVNSEEKAKELVNEILEIGETQGFKPMVFATMPQPKINKILTEADCHYYEIFESFLDKIGKDLHAEPTRESGLSHGMINNTTYDARIDALNFSLKHDDAMVLKTIDQADIIIIGVSRSGKTPTSLYLSLKFGIKVANYPITEDDFEKNELPQVIIDNRDKIFATTIKPKRLKQIREKRIPNSEYSKLETCKTEIEKANALYEKYGFEPMDVTKRSIEELSAQIMKSFKNKDIKLHPSKHI